MPIPCYLVYAGYVASSLKQLELQKYVFRLFVVVELPLALISLLWVKECGEMVLHSNFIKTWKRHEKMPGNQSEGHPTCHGGLQILLTNSNLFL